MLHQFWIILPCNESIWSSLRLWTTKYIALLFSWEVPLHWCRIKHWLSGQSPPPKKLLFPQCADWNWALCVPAVLPYICRLQLHCKMHSDPQFLLLKISFFSRAMTSMHVEMFLWPDLDCLPYERSVVLQPNGIIVWWATIPSLLILFYSVSADTKLICYALYVPWWLQCWLVSQVGTWRPGKTGTWETSWTIQMWEV